MITKSYGDSSENIYEYNSESGTSESTFFKRIHNKNLDLLESDDVSSANTLNRSTKMLYEDEKNNYLAFQNLTKLLLQDKKNCYINGIFEGFGKENLKIIKSPFSNDRKYLRIPTGALVINKAVNDIHISGVDDFENRKISTDDNVSIYINSPNVSVFERELAKHFGIDLNEGSNSVEVGYEFKNSKIYYNYKLSILRNELETVKVDGEDVVYPKITEKIIDEKIRETDSDGNEVITGAEELNNVSQIVKSVNSKILKSYKKTDDFYSLEEVIPLKILANKQYAYVFFNTNIGKTNEEYYTEEDTYYSHSGKFCLHLTNESALDETSSELTKYGLLLYKIHLEGLPSISDTTYSIDIPVEKVTEFLNPIDRNLLELRKLNVNYETKLFGKIELLNDIKLTNNSEHPEIIKIDSLPNTDTTLNINVKIDNTGAITNSGAITNEVTAKITNNSAVTNNGTTTINNTLYVKKDESTTYSWVLANDNELNDLV